MIAAWMFYAAVIAGLTGGAALAGEGLLRAHRRPARWVWTASALASVLWALRLVVPADWLPWGVAEAQELAPAAPPAWALALDPLTVPIASDSLLQRLDGPLTVLWILVSGVLLLSGVALLLRTARLRRAWEGREEAGRAYFLSDDCGPAVVGVFKPAIVLPRWCRTMEARALALILDHEEEHRRAGDLPLILAAAVLAILFPWNLPLWWHFRRLRLAVEADCDLRVLKKNPESIREYLGLLLEVGRRPSLRGAAATMLSENDGTLERRIKIMTTPKPTHPLRQGLLLGSAAAFLVVLACGAPEPQEGALDPTEPAAQLPPPTEKADLSAQPTFTPYTVKPDVKNRAEVVEALEAEYPPLLRDAGIGGMVLVWFFIDRDGKVAKLQINESSGHKALDEAALRVGSRIEFTPALNRDERVPVWISLPIAFTTSEGRENASPSSGGGTPEKTEDYEGVAGVVQDVAEALEKTGEAVARTVGAGEREAEVVTVTTEPSRKPGEPGRNPVSQADLDAAPTFTPYTVKPDVKNRREVQAALEREYPPLLRDAGISGRVMVWLFIDENGRVANTMINQTSGHLALDDAALRVAKTIEFTPALNRDERVPVWISLPITFMTR